MLSEFLVWLVSLFRFNSLSEGKLSQLEATMALLPDAYHTRGPQRKRGMASSDTGRKKLNQREWQKRETSSCENIVGVKYIDRSWTVSGNGQFCCLIWNTSRWLFNHLSSLPCHLQHPHPFRTSHRQNMSPPEWWWCIQIDCTTLVSLHVDRSNYSVIAARDPVGDEDLRRRRRAVLIKFDSSHASQLLLSCTQFSDSRMGTCWHLYQAAPPIWFTCFQTRLI